jgi:hypothetical protein
MECDGKGEMQPVNQLCGHERLQVKSEGERRDSVSRAANLAQTGNRQKRPCSANYQRGEGM